MNSSEHSSVNQQYIYFLLPTKYLYHSFNSRHFIISPSFTFFAPLAQSSLKTVGGVWSLPFSLLHVTQSVFPFDRKDSLGSSRKVCVCVCIDSGCSLDLVIVKPTIVRQALWDISHSTWWIIGYFYMLRRKNMARTRLQKESAAVIYVYLWLEHWPEGTVRGQALGRVVFAV